MVLKSRLGKELLISLKPIQGKWAVQGPEIQWQELGVSMVLPLTLLQGEKLSTVLVMRKLME